MNLPFPVRQLFRGWMAFSHVFGMIMSTIILTILWIAGFGIYAVILRIVNFPKYFQKAPESYWIVARPMNPDEMRYPF